MDYNEAAPQIVRALRGAGVFLKVTLGRDSGRPIRGRDVIVKVDTDMMDSRDVFAAITKALKPQGYSPLQSGKVWGSSDKTVWVDGEGGYHLGSEPEKTYTIRVRQWPFSIRAATGDLGPIPKEIHKLQDAVSDWEAAIYHAIRAVIRAPQFGPLLIDMIQGVSEINSKQLPGLRRQYRQAGDGKEKNMSTVKQALQRIASEVPESRQYLVPLLQRHASCGCGDDRMAGELDEMFAGRKYDPGPHKNETYGPPYKSEGMDKGKWDPQQKGKCFYETGDEADRCYTTTNGGPGGPKPDTGSSKNRAEYNKKYRKQRWDMKSAEGQAGRLAELRAMRTAAWKAPSNSVASAGLAKVVTWPWMPKSLDDLRSKIGGGVLKGMTQMRERIDSQDAIKKWADGLSKDALHTIFRATEKKQNGKRKEQYDMSEAAWNKLS